MCVYKANNGDDLRELDVGYEPYPEVIAEKRPGKFGIWRPPVAYPRQVSVEKRPRAVEMAADSEAKEMMVAEKAQPIELPSPIEARDSLSELHSPTSPTPSTLTSDFDVASERMRAEP